MANVQYYDVILKPVVTEKSMNAMAEKKYTFLVHPDANKTWCCSWKNCENKESYRSVNRR